MMIKIVAYSALPCEAAEFIVNGVEGHKWDFGHNCEVGSFDYEYGPSDDENWACANNQFVPKDAPAEGILEKYGITLEEYRLVQEECVSKFNVGGCGYCV